MPESSVTSMPLQVFTPVPGSSFLLFPAQVRQGSIWDILVLDRRYGSYLRTAAMNFLAIDLETRLSRLVQVIAA